MEIKGDLNTLLISGKIRDKSKIKTFTINNEPVTMAGGKTGEYDFLASVNLGDAGKITIKGIDDYSNEKTIEFPLKRTEIIPPLIALIAPYTTDDGTVFLDSPTPNIAIQGKITDGSRIKTITVGNYIATYLPTELTRHSRQPSTFQTSTNSP